MYVNQQVKYFLAKGLVINYGKRGLQNKSGGGGASQVLPLQIEEGGRKKFYLC